MVVFFISSLENWLSLSEEDKDNSDYLFKGRRYAASCYFAHQRTEKLIKAYIISKFNILPRKSHKIKTLLNDAEIRIGGLSRKMVIDIDLVYDTVKYPDIRNVIYSNRQYTIYIRSISDIICKWIYKNLYKKK